MRYQESSEDQRERGYGGRAKGGAVAMERGGGRKWEQGQNGGKWRRRTTRRRRAKVTSAGCDSPTQIAKAMKFTCVRRCLGQFSALSFSPHSSSHHDETSANSFLFFCGVGGAGMAGEPLLLALSSINLTRHYSASEWGGRGRRERAPHTRSDAH